MKLITKTGCSRLQPRSNKKEEALQNSIMALRRQSVPYEAISNIHYARRETFPVAVAQHNPERVINQEKYKVSSKTSSNEQKNVVKVQAPNTYRQDWKILTLQQIRSRREPRVVMGDSKIGQSQKSRQKLFVSLSKSNASSISGSRQSLSEPKLIEINENHILLKSLSSGGRIVEKVELQLGDGTPRNDFRCW